jgi:site-specific DNA recombinase
LRAAAYARVSTKRQAEKQLSISAQLRAIRGYARERGWEIVDEFTDAGYSGRDRNRPGLKALVVAACSGRIDAVVVWKLDRLARDTLISAGLRQQFTTNNVQLVSLHEHTGDSPQEKLVARIFEGLAEFYSDNLSQDIRRGQREVARRGFYPFPHAPIGYRRVETRDGRARRFLLAPDETYGPVLAGIFADYASGKTATQISKTLNEKAIPAGSARRWTAKRIYYVLKNSAYCGDVTIGRRDGPPESLEVVKDVHEPLVDRDTFSRIQAILEARAGNHAIARWESSPYLLSGLVRCGLCGSHMVGTSAKSGQYHYYTCQLYHQQGEDACPGVRVSQRDLENSVMSEVRKLVLDDKNLQLLVQLVNERLSDLKTTEQSSLEATERKIQGLRRRLQRNYDALESGLLDLEELAPRIRELRSEIREAERTRDEIKQRVRESEASALTLEGVLPYARKLRETLRIGSFKQRKVFLAGVVNAVRVGRESVELDYRLPLPQVETGDLVSPALQSVTSSGGGGSRTRVRRYGRSASTSLDPCFGFGADPPAGRMARA